MSKMATLPLLFFILLCSHFWQFWATARAISYHDNDNDQTSVQSHNIPLEGTSLDSRILSLNGTYTCVKGRSRGRTTGSKHTASALLSSQCDLTERYSTVLKKCVPTLTHSTRGILG